MPSPVTTTKGRPGKPAAHKSTVSGMRAKGLDVDTDGQTDPEKVNAIIAEAQERAKASRKADERYRLARAEREELSVQKQRNELLAKADVEKALFLVARQVRDALMNLPDRLAPVLVGETSAQIHALISKEIRIALEELSEHCLTDSTTSL